MHYSVLLRRGGKLEDFKDAILEGIISKKQIMYTAVEFVDKLGICEGCRGDISHVIDSDGNKFCPILFNDLIKPEWNVKQLV